MDPFIAIGCVVGAFVVYTFLVLKNLKEIRATKQERLEARRAYRAARTEARKQAHRP